MAATGVATSCALATLLLSARQASMPRVCPPKYSVAHATCRMVLVVAPLHALAAREQGASGVREDDGGSKSARGR